MTAPGRPRLLTGQRTALLRDAEAAERRAGHGLDANGGRWHRPSA